MKKYPILLFTLILFCLSVFSQNEIPKNDDFSAIVLNVYVPINGKIPEEANGLLESKLRQIASANGLGGTNYSNPRFVLTATVHQLTSEQISESLLYYINAEIVYYVVDAAEKELAKRGWHYQAGGLIVTVTTDPTSGDPAIAPSTAAALTSAPLT